jgi:hypothetical protein
MNKPQFNFSTHSLDHLLPSFLTRGFQIADESSAESAESVLLAKEFWLEVDFATA